MKTVKKGGPAIAALLGKPGGMGSKKDEDSSNPDMSEDEDISLDDDEKEAFAAFEAAKGSDDKAKALKAFIKICGGY